MGKDLSGIAARFADGAADTGRLQWEGSRLIFRGAARRVFEGEALGGISAAGDALLLADGSSFSLPPGQAPKWAHAIANPPSRLDKLGVKAGQRIGVLNLADPTFGAELAARQVPVADHTALDLLFYGADSAEELALIPGLIPLLAEKGAIWIVSRKGKAAGVTDTDVFAAARPAGLTDTKVCGFSETLTALRFIRRR
jgi:hypothetical protein